jgi:hypothetical protein
MGSTGRRAARGEQAHHPRGSRGQVGLVRTTGIRLAAAARDLRVLREYVHETRRARDSVEDLVVSAACYLRG